MLRVKSLFIGIYLWGYSQRFNLLIFTILLTAVYILQKITFEEQLRYGFRDGDWSSIRKYLTAGNWSLEHFVNSWKYVGGYVYQLYYPGILFNIYGIDFKSMHQVSHLLKLIATLTLFPLVLVLTKNKMTALVSTLIYAVAYPTAGALYMLATGAYFLAIIFLNFFFISYYYTFKQKKLNIKQLILTQILFLTAFGLGPERFYPLIPFIFLIESLWVITHKSKLAIKNYVLRLFILFSPFMLFYLIYIIWLKEGVNSGMFVGGLLSNVESNIRSILIGNWHLILNPVASFGSMFFYGDFWKVFGVIDTSSFSGFLGYFIKGPMFIFGAITLVLMSFLGKNSVRLILLVLTSVFIFGLFIYAVSENWYNIPPNLRVHLDINLVGPPALFGFYILSLSFSFFLVWLNNKEKRIFLLPMFLGTFVSFFFIFLTWLASDVRLIFMGSQRYLTSPAIGSSLFLGSTIVFIFTILRKSRFGKNIAWIVLLLVVPIIIFNIQITKQFFNYELDYVGMDGVEQTRIKNKFWSIASSISNTEPSLFYFDESADYKNGYFDESTIMAGFDDWIFFDNGKNFIIDRPSPQMIRTNIHCPEKTHLNCLNVLKESLIVKDGEWGFIYKDPFSSTPSRFYKLSNFYAMRFIEKDLVGIKKEVIRELGIDE